MPEKKLVVITDRDHVDQRKREIEVPSDWDLEVKSYAEHGGGG